MPDPGYDEAPPPRRPEGEQTGVVLYGLLPRSSLYDLTEVCMAQSPGSPTNIFGEWVQLPDGRRVRVLAYDDGSIRFRVEGAPYMMAEAFLTGTNGNAILKLVPAKNVAPA